jgi:tRNA-dihydrouridine synthase B
MKIGSITLENNTVLAPLAGITNLPFRLRIKAAGCGLVCSEMISARGMVHDSHKTLMLMDSAPEEKPLSVQIFGFDPAYMAEAAAMVEAAGADILDINFGCSVRKVVKIGAGAALMREPAVAEAVIRAVRKAIKIPFTIKVRSGWDSSGAQAFELCRIAEDSGVDAVAVHPRTATQGFGGEADWSLIAAIKKQVSIPVIGNGDIKVPQDAVDMFNRTGCDAVMIGRAAIGNPWIFSQVNALLKGEEVSIPDLSQHFDEMIKYLEDSVRYIGETHACRMMRSRLCWFVKGLPHSSRFRESIKRVSTEAEARKLIEAYRESVLKLKVPKVR